MIFKGCEKCGSKDDLQLHYVNLSRNINNKLGYIKLSAYEKQILLCRLCLGKIHIGYV